MTNVRKDIGDSGENTSKPEIGDVHVLIWSMKLKCYKTR